MLHLLVNKKPFKVRVNEAKSILLQKRCFDLGIFWFSGTKNVQNTTYDYLNFDWIGSLYCMQASNVPNGEVLKFDEKKYRKLSEINFITGIQKLTSGDIIFVNDSVYQQINHEYYNLHTFSKVSFDLRELQTSKFYEGIEVNGLEEVWYYLEKRNPFKIVVNEEASKKIQELCFKKGIYWGDGSKKICSTDEKYLFVDEVIKHGYNKDQGHFLAHQYPEIGVSQGEVLSREEGLKKRGFMEASKKQEILDLISHEVTFKVKVNEITSKELQELCLENGIIWGGWRKEISNLDKKYLNIEGHTLTYYTNEFSFNQDNIREVVLDAV